MSFGVLNIRVCVCVSVRVCMYLLFVAERARCIRNWCCNNINYNNNINSNGNSKRQRQYKHQTAITTNNRCEAKQTSSMERIRLHWIQQQHHAYATAADAATAATAHSYFYIRYPGKDVYTSIPKTLSVHSTVLVSQFCSRFHLFLSLFVSYLSK